MKLIPLTQGKFAMVDDEDFDRLNQFKWYAQKTGSRCYAATGRHIYMHRVILGLSGNIMTDHKNGNGLDNQKSNLRPATNAENQQGFRRLKSVKSSVFRGVSWKKIAKLWYVTIAVKGENTHLGCYESEEDAAHVYDYAAKIYFGEFARLNFPG